MEDIFQWCREGNALQVRVWLDDTEHDMNQGDDHGFSPLHWACKEGHLKIVEMLIKRGARINVTNMGDDTPLHLSAAHGHRPVVQLLLQNRVDVNFTNEHGNSPLHYACFWGYNAIAEDLVLAGALVSIANKYGDTPLDKTRGQLVQRLHELATQQGQDLKKIQFKDQSWLGYKTRSRDATLSRHKGININELALHTQIAVTPSGETWRGRWQKNDIVAKILAIRECTPRIQRDFNEEFPKLRIFSHPNILPVVGCGAAAGARRGARHALPALAAAGHHPARLPSQQQTHHDRRRPDGPHQHGGREVFVPRARAGVRAGVDGSRGSAQAGRQAELGGRRYVELRRAVVGAGHQRDTIRGSFTNGVRHEDSA